jgi:hypothetical protein
MTGLTATEARDFAVGHGLVGPAGEVRVTALGGGVSNDTLLVADRSRRVVVKRALGRLRTDLEWHASPRRAWDEAVGLQVAAGMTPEAVPEVLAVDEASATVALAAAPEGWRDWKTELLAGHVEPRVGRRLGEVLATWHAGTRGVVEVRRRLPDLDRMISLRIAPFHDVVARRHGDLGGLIGDAAAQLRERRLCLVHGDFSPKNVLVGDSGVWVIDFEMAHVGNPVFDAAFLQAHLLLKAVANPATRGALAATAEEFSRAYGAPVADMVDLQLGLHTGCLVLSRVDGTSPVHYLSEADIVTARALGRALVDGTMDMESAWKQVASG